MSKRKQPTEAQKMKAAEKREKMQEICRQIKAMGDGERARMASGMQVTRAVDGDALSCYNQCMLCFQRPTVTLVAGFRQWKGLGRMVKKGEHGLCIYIPRFGKTGEDDQGEGKEGELKGFLFGTVFDVTQTEAVAA